MTLKDILDKTFSRQLVYITNAADIEFPVDEANFYRANLNDETLSQRVCYQKVTAEGYLKILLF